MFIPLLRSDSVIECFWPSSNRRKLISKSSLKSWHTVTDFGIILILERTNTATIHGSSSVQMIEISRGDRVKACMCLPYILGKVPLCPFARWNFWSSDHSGPGLGFQGWSVAHFLRVQVLAAFIQCRTVMQLHRNGVCAAGHHLIKARLDLPLPPTTCLKYFESEILPASWNT